MRVNVQVNSRAKLHGDVTVLIARWLSDNQHATHELRALIRKVEP
jgi:hypothetical protein